MSGGSRSKLMIKKKRYTYRFRFRNVIVHRFVIIEFYFLHATIF